MKSIYNSKSIIYSFEYLRVFSTFMIVLCHLFYLNNVFFYLGTYLSSFVEVFFILSSLLLGFKYSNIKLTWSNFFQKRITRLITSYYPYLFLLFIWIFLMHDELISLKVVIAHLLFVNWFTRSFDYSYGHLWFLSMIMLCYLFIMTTSRINFKIDKRALLFISLFIISAFFLCYKLSINPRIITALMLFTYFFHKGSYFLNYIFSLKFTVITPLYIGVNLLGLYTLFIYNGLIDYKFLAAFLCSVIAISNVIFLIKIFMFFSENKVVNFFSIISFEIYLVHHPLILGKYSLINSFFDNIFINIFFTLLIIIIISWILQYLSQKINKIILIKLIKKTPKKY